MFFNYFWFQINSDTNPYIFATFGVKKIKKFELPNDSNERFKDNNKICSSFDGCILYI